LHRRADVACDDLITQYTAAAPAPIVASAPRDALDELRSLVAADGADFETIEFDGAAGTMRLRLVVPDAHCADCVMPRAALESIAATRLAHHGVRTVVIDDPREAPR
jgi:hypothetical protein